MTMACLGHGLWLWILRCLVGSQGASKSTLCLRILHSISFPQSCTVAAASCTAANASCTAAHCRFMANLVMTQYIEQGPVLLANLIQLIPSFNL